MTDEPTQAATRESPQSAQWIGLLAGPAAFAALLLVPLPAEFTVEGRRAAAVAVLMAVWWMTEAIPLAATALIPLAAFPLLGVLRPEAAAAPYANPVVFLFLGGFLLALAMERWGLHRRIALRIVAAVGASPRRLVLGFMLATAFLSLWISNTATAALMLPTGIALAELLRPAGTTGKHGFGTALLLGIAYAATIGGLGTLIGTPPNLILAAAARELVGREIDFVAWMMVGLPLVAVLLPLGWLVLVHTFPCGQANDDAEEFLRQERHALGRATRPERIVAVVFTLAALAWIVREPKSLGGLRLPGLNDVLPGIDDSTIGILAGLVLFLLPTGRRPREFVLDWSIAGRLPWGVLLLFGGGLSLARALDETGVTGAIGTAVTALGGVPPLLLVAAVVACFIFFSELASNTAIAAMAMPILAAAAVGVGQQPIALMAAGALAASTAFMLPVGTPPNAIVFGSGQVEMRDMIRVGIWLNLASIPLVALLAYYLAPRVLG